MFLYTADGFTGQPVPCDEGTLEWVPKRGDRPFKPVGRRPDLFFRLMDEGEPFFFLKLHYYGNRLSEAVLNGESMELLDVLDEGGEPSGLVRERSMVHERGDYHRTSHVGWSGKKPDGSHGVLLRSAAAGRIPLRAATIFPAPAIFRRETDTSSQPDGSLRRSWGSPLRRKNWNLPVFFESQYEGDFTESPLSTAKKAAVYVYRRPVEAEHLELQADEVESVRWMDLEKACQAAKNTGGRLLFTGRRAAALKKTGSRSIQKDPAGHQGRRQIRRTEKRWNYMYTFRLCKKKMCLL